jgi:ATP-dependent helicase/nuclease subunit A
MMPEDQEDRSRAVESGRNVAVIAGAGTGKTTLLVEKILRKVLREGVPVERILALTFTEKAANEMRQRLRGELAKAGRSEGLDRAEIGTIHSFCAHVLRQFPLEAGVAPDFTVDEGAVFRRRFDEAWPRWLDRELGPEARRPRSWQEVLEKVELRHLRDLARGLASFAVPEERSDPQKALDDILWHVSWAMPDLAPALAGEAEPPRRVPPRAGPLARSAVRLAQDLRKIDRKTVGRAVEMVSEFARAFRRDYLAAGWVSFDAMLALTHDLLRGDRFPAVRDLLRERYRSILVDEFQDTDPLQGEIIQRLAEGPDGRLVPGKLFIVGDPKQSIYSFRGADIVAYQELVDRILREGGERAVLRTNFRSHGGLLDFVNAVFEKVIVENRKLQPRYEPILPAPDRKPLHPGPSIEAVVVEGAGAEESREVEAVEIARWILGHRHLPHREIAILFRSLVDVPMYLEALRAHGIPYVVDGEKFFYRTPEVIDFVNLLRAAANPHDRLAVAGALRSPYGGLSDAELYEHRKGLDYRVEAAGGPPLFRFLRRWHELSGRAGVAELIDTVFTESYALEIAQAGVHGEQAVANLLKLRQKAAELEAEGGCTLAEFLETAAEAVRDLEEEGESPLADETLDAVRISSIHKAKGLEFPVVILPDLHRARKPPGERAVRFEWTTGTLGVRLGEVCDAGGAALAFREREREREEHRRILYVAATRAREILVCMGSLDAPGETYLKLLLPELENRGKVTRRPCDRPPNAPAAPAPGREKPDWEGFVAHWRERERRAAGAADPFTSPTKLEEASRVERALLVREEAPGAGRAADVGTACHEVLEKLDFASPRVPPGTDPEAAGILEGFFGSEAFRELAGSEILARELPFVIPRGDGIVQGVIDVVYRRGGTLFVADYKSDRVKEPRHYGLIREIYSEAVRRVLGEEPRFKLVYLRFGESVEP